MDGMLIGADAVRKHPPRPFCAARVTRGVATQGAGRVVVRRLLGVPRGKRIPLLIAVGYGEEPLRAKIRKTTDAMASWNRY